jgi:predicted dinucleotide-binding enzyme
MPGKARYEKVDNYHGLGIIGSGNIGSTLARHLTVLRHQVAIANSRGPDSLAGLAAETGAIAVR